MFEFTEIFTEIHRCFVILRSTGRSLSTYPPLIGITMKISGVLCLKLRNVILTRPLCHAACINLSEKQIINV